MDQRLRDNLLFQSYERRDTAKTTDINPLNDEEDELVNLDDSVKNKAKKKKISLVPRINMKNQSAKNRDVVFIGQNPTKGASG